MAIYNINAESLSEAYAINGNRIGVAYDVAGNIVFTEGEPVDYNSYTYETIWQNSDMQSLNNTQGFAYCDGKIFWFRAANNSSGQVYVIDAETGQTIIESTNIRGGHANCECFSTKYFADGDAYPLLYAGGAADTMMTFVNRITQCSSNNFNSELIETIVLSDEAGTRRDVCLSQHNSNILVSVGYSSDNSFHYICWWDLRNMTINASGTKTPAFIRRIATSTTHGTKQSIREHGGYVWVVYGYTNQAGYVSAFNETTGAEEYLIDLETTIETEGIEFVEDENSEGGYAMYIGFQNGQMRKYLFD